jgi:hypothetical protein
MPWARPEASAWDFIVPVRKSPSRPVRTSEPDDTTSQTRMPSTTSDSAREICSSRVNSRPVRSSFPPVSWRSTPAGGSMGAVTTVIGPPQ